MDGLENVISVLDYVLDTKRKRHIMGGILLSVSFLFGGLAITVMTIKTRRKRMSSKGMVFLAFIAGAGMALYAHGNC
mgnify:CR=1 FL=1